MHCSNCKTEIREGSMFCHQCGILLERLLEFEDVEETNDLLARPSVTTWPENPWIKIWTEPRATIRAIVDTRPDRYVIPIAILSGIAQAIARSASDNLGDSMSLVMVFIISVVVGAISGVISLYIGGAISAWVGNKLEGKANSDETRAAIAWASIPTIFGMVFLLPNLALYGSDLFTTNAPRIANNPIPLLIMGGVEFILGLWAIGLLITCLSEVHQFSIGKAIATLLIPGLVVAVVFFACILISF